MSQQLKKILLAGSALTAALSVSSVAQADTNIYYNTVDEITDQEADSLLSGVPTTYCTCGSNYVYVYKETASPSTTSSSTTSSSTTSTTSSSSTSTTSSTTPASSTPDEPSLPSSTVISSSGNQQVLPATGGGFEVVPIVAGSLMAMTAGLYYVYRRKNLRGGDSLLLIITVGGVLATSVATVATINAYEVDGALSRYNMTVKDEDSVVAPAEIDGYEYVGYLVDSSNAVTSYTVSYEYVLEDENGNVITNSASNLYFSNSSGVSPFTGELIHSYLNQLYSPIASETVDSGQYYTTTLEELGVEANQVSLPSDTSVTSGYYFDGGSLSFTPVGLEIEQDDKCSDATVRIRLQVKGNYKYSYKTTPSTTPITPSTTAITTIIPTTIAVPTTITTVFHRVDLEEDEEE